MILFTNMKKQKNTFFPRMTSNNVLSFLISLLALHFSAGVYAAEFVYISDNLRVGVRTEPVGGVPPISVVFTGMRLEVHERTDGYVKITTDKGVTGWIKDIYVTKKAPAIIQLNVVRAKYEKLQKELSLGNDAVVTLEKTNLALTKQIDELKSERREWSRERANLMASQYKDSSWFSVIVLIVLMVVSFFAGIYWYKTQVMKRFGGLRV